MLCTVSSSFTVSVSLGAMIPVFANAARLTYAFSIPPSLYGGV